MAFDSDNEDMEFTENVSSHIIIAIDCNPSMFDQTEHGSAFQMAMKSVNKVNEDLMLNKAKKNKVAVLLYHSDPDKVVLMDFEMPFIETTKKLKRVNFMDDSTIKAEYCCKSKRSFHEFLQACRKVFLKVDDHVKCLFFATNHDDPCSDDSDKFQALRSLKEGKLSNIQFHLLPMIDEFDFKPFYREAYDVLEVRIPPHYYNMDFMVERLRSAVRFRQINKRITLHISAHPNSTASIVCYERTYCKKAKYLKSKMTRDLQTVVRSTYKKTENFEKQFNMKIPLNTHSKQIQLTKQEKDWLNTADSVKVGLSIVHASTEPYSSDCIWAKNSRLLCPKDAHDKEFASLWESCVMNNLYLLCDLKYRITSKVHAAELRPVNVHEERQFLLTVIPHKINIRCPDIREREKEYSDPQTELFEDLIEKMTLENYDPTTYRPYPYKKKTEYFKNELIQQVDVEGWDDVISYASDSEEPQYQHEAASKVLNELQDKFPKVAKKGKRKAGAGAGGKKKGKFS